MKILHTKAPAVLRKYGYVFIRNRPTEVDNLRVAKILIDTEGYDAKTYGFINEDVKRKIEAAEKAARAKAEAEAKKELDEQIRTHEAEEAKRLAEEEKLSQERNLANVQREIKYLKGQELYDYATKIGVLKADIDGKNEKEIKQAIIAFFS